MQVTSPGSYPRTEPGLQPPAVHQNPLNALAPSVPPASDVAILQAAFTAAMDLDFLLGWPNAPRVNLSPALAVTPGSALAELPAKLAEGIAAPPGMAQYGPALIEAHPEDRNESSPDLAFPAETVDAPAGSSSATAARAALAIHQYKAFVEAQPDVAELPQTKLPTAASFPHWPVLDAPQKAEMPLHVAATERIAAAKPSRIRPGHMQFERFRRFCRRLPLLAILLAWLALGAVAGLLALPFEHGTIAEMRHVVFPLWAMGCLALIVFAFLRSSLRFLRQHR